MRWLYPMSALDFDSKLSRPTQVTEVRTTYDVGCCRAAQHDLRIGAQVGCNETHLGGSFRVVTAQVDKYSFVHLCGRTTIRSVLWAGGLHADVA